jgi:hypothetical protein
MSDLKVLLTLETAVKTSSYSFRSFKEEATSISTLRVEKKLNFVFFIRHFILNIIDSLDTIRKEKVLNRTVISIHGYSNYVISL